MKSNQRIFNAWFENWLISHLPKLMYQPKWIQNSHHVKKGDVVFFLKQDSSLQTKYQYGKVKSVVIGRDGLIRKVYVKYRNFKEHTDRETFRSVRELVVIHGVDELNIVQELGLIASIADLKFQNETGN